MRIAEYICTWIVKLKEPVNDELAFTGLGIKVFL